MEKVGLLEKAHGERKRESRKETHHQTSGSTATPSNPSRPRAQEEKKIPSPSDILSVDRWGDINQVRWWSSIRKSEKKNEQLTQPICLGNPPWPRNFE